MTEINSDTPITRKEIFDAAETIIQYLESVPHNATNIATARRGLRRILLGEIEKPVATPAPFDPTPPRGPEVTEDDIFEHRMNRHRAGLRNEW